MDIAQDTGERLLTDAELDAVNGGNPILVGIFFAGCAAFLIGANLDNGLASMEKQAAALGMSHLL